MLPNFFIIGSAKCGTTSLHSYLGAHPDVHMSPIKEPHFFAAPDTTPPFLEGRIATQNRYERLFESDASARGEASGSYSHHPWRPGVPERIAALVPEARFVYIVRDPLEKVVSGYLQRVATEGERRPLPEALGDLDDKLNRYLSAACFATQVERYRDVFPATRMHVVDRDDLYLRRNETLASIFEFLGVDPDFESPAFDAEKNVTRSNRQLSHVYRTLRRTRATSVIQRLPEALRQPAVSIAHRVATRPLPTVELDDALARRLRDVFGDEVGRLRELTGKAFAGWSL